MSQDKGVLSRYALVLEALATSPAGLTFSEIMRSTRLPRGTVHRLIGALRDVGYIEPIDGRKVYRLGARLTRMLYLGTSAEVIRNLAQPILEGLASRYDETAFLAKLTGHEVISVAAVLPSSQGQSCVQPGRVMPVHATASGKAIIAYQDESTVTEAIGTKPETFTHKTQVDVKEIREELKGVVQQGYAICDEELDPNIFSYACPVLLEDASVIYSIGLVGISERLHKFPAQEIIADLKSAAQEMAVLLSRRIE